MNILTVLSFFLNTALAVDAASVVFYAQDFAVTIGPVPTGGSSGPVVTSSPDILHPNALRVLKKIFTSGVVDQILLAMTAVSRDRGQGSPPIRSIVLEGITVGLGTGLTSPATLSTARSSTSSRSTRTTTTTRTSSEHSTTPSSSTTRLSQSVTVFSPTVTTASQTASITATMVPTATGYYLNPTFINIMVQTHNDYRALHAAPPVTWDREKALFAQNYANKCQFSHSGGPYGENLAIGGFSNPGYYAYLWYNERKDYPNYANPNFDNFHIWGHFTQVVWNSTTSIGCGYANTCFNLGVYGPYYLVCEYNTGNVLPVQNFVANVLPPNGPSPYAPPGSAPY